MVKVMSEKTILYRTSYFIGRLIGRISATVVLKFLFILKLPFLLVWWTFKRLLHFFTLVILTTLLGQRSALKILGIETHVDDANFAKICNQSERSRYKENKAGKHWQQPKYQPYPYVMEGNIQILGTYFRSPAIKYIGTGKWIIKLIVKRNGASNRMEIEVEDWNGLKSRGVGFRSSIGLEWEKIQY